MSSYGFSDHVHRFAAWAAATAARSSKLCRFSGEQGHQVVNEAQLRRDIVEGTVWELDASDFDALHKRLRNRTVLCARRLSVGRDGFTHGVAAKLINVYVKVSLIARGEAVWTDKLSIHPPIDRILLNTLSKAEHSESTYLRSMANKGWSTFGSDESEAVIRALRQVAASSSVPLWKLESEWAGYQ